MLGASWPPVVLFWGSVCLVVFISKAYSFHFASRLWFYSSLVLLLGFLPFTCFPFTLLPCIIHLPYTIYFSCYLILVFLLLIFLLLLLFSPLRFSASSWYLLLVLPSCLLFALTYDPVFVSTSSSSLLLMSFLSTSSSSLLLLVFLPLLRLLSYSMSILPLLAFPPAPPLSPAPSFSLYSSSYPLLLLLFSILLPLSILIR